MPLKVFTHWLSDQLINIERLPVELVRFAGLKSVYLVKSFISPDVAGLAQAENGAIYINLPMLYAGSETYSYAEENIFPHELGHLIHAQLVKRELVDNTILEQLARQFSIFDVPICSLLVNYDREDAAVNPSEQAAALIARLLRREPLKPVGRIGVALTSAYLLDALDRALPGYNIADYLMSLGKSVDWRLGDRYSQQINQQWQVCQIDQGRAIKADKAA